MPRPVPGIQLGRSAQPALLRGAELAAAGLGVIAVWGAVSLFGVRAELRDAEAATRSAIPPPEQSGAETRAEPELARAAAVLLLSGALGAPDYGSVFETVAEAAPPGVRITGIEVRPKSETGRVLAAISAEAASGAAVAGFLSSLAGRESVLSTEIISETRRADGGATIRITAELDARRRFR